jgi:membrane-associated protein
METLSELFHQLREYLNPKIIIEILLAKGGIFVYVGLIFIVFAETGLAVGFFLPGDSLLVVAGLFAAAGKLNLAILVSTLFIAAVVGDAVGYYTGAKLGPRIFKRQKSLLFRPSHLQRAHAFYEKYGGKTIVIARFVPIVRTFAPIVAGAAEMPYRRFVVFNVAGGFLWVSSMLLSGYFLGSVLKSRFGIDLEEHIEWVVIVVVLISLMPPFIEYFKSRREKSRAAGAGKAEVLLPHVETHSKRDLT